MGPELRPALLLGCGLGAFVDGILLHQILQWHNMLSGVRPPLDLVSMKYNMLYDGLFHALAWSITGLGVVEMWRLARRAPGNLSSGRFVSGIVAGWGGFNALEGIIDHQLLGLHHVHPGSHELVWDCAFVVSGALMLLVGLVSARRAAAAVAPTG